MLRIASLVTLALLASLVPIGSARADAPHTSTTPPPPPPPVPPAPWRQSYHEGSTAYAAGRLDEALADFQRAIDQGGPPTLLYDLALTLDRLGRASDAIAAYQRYLDAAPEASNRDVVEARLAQLQPPSGALASHVAPPPAPIFTLVTPDAPATTVTTTTSSSDAYRATHPRPTTDHWEQQGPEWVVSWVMLGLTAVSTLSAVLVWNDGVARFRELQDLCASPMGCTATDIDQSSAHTSQDASNALLGVSIGLGAITILTFVLEGVVTSNRTRFVRGDASRGDGGPRIGLGPFGVSLSGSF